MRKLWLRDQGSLKLGVATVSVEAFHNCQHWIGDPDNTFAKRLYFNKNFNVLLGNNYKITIKEIIRDRNLNWLNQNLKSQSICV